MKVLIDKTEKTPYVHFDEGIIEIKGRSILEDSLLFYKPLIKWINEYIESPAPKTIVKFGIEYSNSNSNKFIYKMFQLFEKCYKNGNDIKVEWTYEQDDDGIKDLGIDLKALFDLPFIITEINSN